MTTIAPKLLLASNIVHQILVRFSPPFFNLHDHVVQSFGFNTSAMLLLSGSCKNCQSSSSSMPVKQRSTISLLTSSNLEGSHWKKKGKNENETVTQHKRWKKECRLRRVMGFSIIYTWGFLSLSTSIALAPCRCMFN
jgi:hypothetical protein